MPMFPRGMLFYDKAKSMLGFALTQPLLSWKILSEAIGTAGKLPFKALTALILLIRYSTNVRVLTKNLVVYPKGLWLAKVATEWKAEHIYDLASILTNDARRSEG